MMNQATKSIPKPTDCNEGICLNEDNQKERQSHLDWLLTNSIDISEDTSSEELSKTIITLIYKKNINPNLDIVDTYTSSNIYSDGDLKYIEFNTEICQKDLPVSHNQFTIHTDYIFMKNSGKTYLIYKKSGIFEEIYNKLKEDDIKNSKELIKSVTNLLKTTFQLNREINLNNFLKEE
jgi:hypothetical protein